MILTFTSPITVDDLAKAEVLTYTPNDKTKIGIAIVQVSSAVDVPYGTFTVIVGNGESTGLRAVVGKAVSYSAIMENFTAKTSTGYDDVTTAYIKNGGTVNTALGAVASALVIAGLLPAGNVA